MSKKRNPQNTPFAYWTIIFFVSGLLVSPLIYAAGDAMGQLIGSVKIAADQAKSPLKKAEIDGYIVTTNLRTLLSTLSAPAKLAPILIAGSITTIAKTITVASLVYADRNILLTKVVSSCPALVSIQWGGPCKKDGLILKKDKMYEVSNLTETSDETAVDIRWGNSGFLRYSNGPLLAPVSASVRSDYSFASLWQVGTGDLDQTTCPAFKLIKPDNFTYVVYPYIDGTPQTDGSVVWNAANFPKVIKDGVYCGVSSNTGTLYKFKVTSVSTTEVKINIRWLGGTNQPTHTCADGLCSSQARSYCVGCKNGDIPFAQEDLRIRSIVKSCLDRTLNADTTRPTVRIIYPDSLSISEGGGERHGLSSKVHGFEGIIQPGSSRVTSVGDIRVSLHEMMHQYNKVFLSQKTPSWLDEGFAIAFGKELNCDSKQLTDSYYAPGYVAVRDGSGILTAPQDGLGHSRGSHFFEGLKIDYGCNVACLGRFWKKLVDSHSDKNADVTITEIKSAAQSVLKKDITPLLNVLQITDATN